MLEAEERASAKVGYNSEKFNPVQTGFSLLPVSAKGGAFGGRLPPQILTSKPLMIRLPTLRRMLYSSFPTPKYSLTDTIAQSDVII